MLPWITGRMMYRQPVPVTGVTGAFLHVHRLSLSPKSNSIEPPSNKCPRACTGPPIQDSRPKNICRGQVFFLIAQSSAMRDPTAFTYIYGLCTFTHIFMRSPISSETLSITRIKFFIIFFFFVSCVEIFVLFFLQFQTIKANSYFF